MSTKKSYDEIQAEKGLSPDVKTLNSEKSYDEIQAEKGLSPEGATVASVTETPTPSLGTRFLDEVAGGGEFINETQESLELTARALSAETSSNAQNIERLYDILKDGEIGVLTDKGRQQLGEELIASGKIAAESAKYAVNAVGEFGLKNASRLLEAAQFAVGAVPAMGVGALGALKGGPVGGAVATTVLADPLARIFQAVQGQNGKERTGASALDYALNAAPLIFAAAKPVNKFIVNSTPVKWVGKHFTELGLPQEAASAARSVKKSWEYLKDRGALSYDAVVDGLNILKTSYAKTNRTALGGALIDPVAETALSKKQQWVIDYAKAKGVALGDILHPDLRGIRDGLEGKVQQWLGIAGDEGKSLNSFLEAADLPYRQMQTTLGADAPRMPASNLFSKIETAVAEIANTGGISNPSKQINLTKNKLANVLLSTDEAVALRESEILINKQSAKALRNVYKGDSVANSEIRDILTKQDVLSKKLLNIKSLSKTEQDTLLSESLEINEYVKNEISAMGTRKGAFAESLAAGGLENEYYGTIAKALSTPERDAFIEAITKKNDILNNLSSGDLSLKQLVKVKQHFDKASYNSNGLPINPVDAVLGKQVANEVRTHLDLVRAATSKLPEDMARGLTTFLDESDAYGATKKVIEYLDDYFPKKQSPSGQINFSAPQEVSQDMSRLGSKLNTLNRLATLEKTGGNIAQAIGTGAVGAMVFPSYFGLPAFAIAAAHYALLPRGYGEIGKKVASKLPNPIVNAMGKVTSDAKVVSQWYSTQPQAAKSAIKAGATIAFLNKSLAGVANAEDLPDETFAQVVEQIDPVAEKITNQWSRIMQTGTKQDRLKAISEIQNMCISTDDEESNFIPGTVVDGGDRVFIDPLQQEKYSNELRNNFISGDKGLKETAHLINNLNRKKTIPLTALK